MRKTSQLQIRVTTDQKRRLKALADEAGLNVSQYVLSTVLPSRGRGELTERAERLRGSREPAAELGALTHYLLGMPTADLGPVLAHGTVDGLAATTASQVAALVETVARARGLRPPPWVQRLPALPRPHFVRELPSLRPHQMRVTPVAFKRRNVFLDVEAYPSLDDPRLRVPPLEEEPGRWLERLNADLKSRGVLAELCPVASGVARIAYAAQPDTRAITGLFAHASGLTEAITASRPATLAPSVGLEEAVEAVVGAGDGFVELSNLRVYRARPDYLLTATVAALHTGADSGALASMRDLIGMLSLPDRSAVLAVAERFLLRRQLPEGLEAKLATLVPGPPAF